MHLVPFTGLSGPTLTSSYLALSESAYGAGLDQPRHGHDPAYITAVLGGGYCEQIGCAERVVQGGALLFHPAGEEHAVRFTAHRTHVFRVLPLAPMLEAERLARARFADTLERSLAARGIVARMRAAYVSGDVLASLTIDGLACELVACCAAAHTSGAADHTGALRARDVIESRLNRTPSLAQLADEAGCHPVTLTRSFRRTFGCSIGSYIRRRRLEEAARMLRQTGTSISAIAIHHGFADQAHFTRALRRAAGRTPGALRSAKTD
jgi:AraC family transcriptional regulator